jgi:hypothetical protein
MYTCTKCEEVIEDCVVNEKSEKYCKKCATQLKIKKQTKREEIDEKIKSLEVYCKNKGLNCEWIGELRELKNHDCEYQFIKCTNGCQKIIVKKYLSDHLENCEFDKKSCEYCQSTRKELLNNEKKIKSLEEIKKNYEYKIEKFENLKTEFEISQNFNKEYNLYFKKKKR